MVKFTRKDVIYVSKTNKELVAELTASFITSWNSKNNTSAIKINDAQDVFKAFKALIESMDEKDN